jgi:multiple sugar transport system permease protein
MSDPGPELESDSKDRPTIELKTHKYQDRVPIWNRLDFSTKGRIIDVAHHSVLLVFIAAVVFPLYWMVLTAIRPLQATRTRPIQYLPSSVTLENYTEVVLNSNIPLYYFNSLTIALGVVLVTITAATLAGYGLSRIDIPRKKVFARGILFGYMFPSILLAIPLFLFWRQLGIINSRIGIILAESAKTLPFSVWLMWKFFDAVPKSLEESAIMAGATRFRAFYEIALPRARPGIVAIAILAFATSWDEFTIPKILAPSENMWVLTVGLSSLVEQNQVLWGQMMAACSLILIPSFLFVFFLQEHMLRGLRM